MYPAYQAQLSGSPPPPPSSQQNKAMLQREYREKEGECFNTLRDLIKELTGEELRTRQEVLRKTTELLLAASEKMKRGKTRAVTPVPHRAPSPAQLENTASTHADYFTQSAHYPQSGLFNANFNAAYPYYGGHVQNQQYHVIPGADSAFNLTSYPGYGENFGYPQP